MKTQGISLDKIDVEFLAIEIVMSMGGKEGGARTSFDRPVPGEASLKACDKGFRESVAVHMLSLHPDLTEEKIDTLVMLRRSGLLPGIFYRSNALFSKYLVPFLSPDVSSDDIVSRIQENALQKKDQAVSTLLSHSNITVTKSTTHNPLHTLDRQGVSFIHILE
jgi:hypothetical protein